MLDQQPVSVIVDVGHVERQMICGSTTSSGARLEKRPTRPDRKLTSSGGCRSNSSIHAALTSQPRVIFLDGFVADRAELDVHVEDVDRLPAFLVPPQHFLKLWV
jgi:hypothetical protein